MNQAIREDIPVLNNLRNEAIFIGVCTCKMCLKCLKCHRVLISAAPNLGNK